MIMDNDEFREVTESEFAEEMDISPEGMEELTNKKDDITNEKEIEIMEEMNSRLSVKYEYKDAYKVKQQHEVSISSGYVDGFGIHQIAEFMLSVINLTGYQVERVLLETIEFTDCGDEIMDELTYLGYGSTAKEK